MTEICNNTVFISENSCSDKPIGNKVHFVYVLLKIRNKAFLLLLTLLPLFLAEELSASGLLITVSVQLLTLSAVLIPALLSRHFMRWSFDGKVFSFSSGVFAKKDVSVTAQNIRSVSVIKTPFLSVFRAVRLDMRCSDGAKKPEITLYLSSETANRLCTKIMRPSKTKHTMLPRTVPFLLMAASRANFTAGLSAAAIFIFSISSSDKEITEMVYYKISETSEFILPYLPPFLAAAAALFIFGWFVHFFKLCFADARQVTTISDKSLITVRGLVSPRLTCIKRSSVSSCFMKQTLLSSVFRQCSIGVTFLGQGRKQEIYPLSAWHSDDYNSACLDIAGLEKKYDITVTPATDAHFILWLPYASIAAFVVMLWVRLFIISPAWFELISCILAVAEILLLWKCSVGIAGAGRVKLEFSGQHVAITTVRLFSVYSQKIFLGKIARFEVRRTVLQKMRNLCTVYIRAAGASTGLKCRNLPFDMIEALSERIK